MAQLRVWLACAALGAAGLAHAQGTVWKCIEGDGRAHYTNIKRETDGKNCTVVTKEVSVVPGAPQRAAPAAGAASDYPKVDRQTQRSRDDNRRKILEDELAQEQKSLADARAKLTEEQSMRYGDEKNYQRVLDRLKPFQDEVDLDRK